MTIKILNLYAGIGGNRKLWDGDIEVTAIELNPKIAAIYQDFFPQDKVIVTDAHQYLLEHYHEYDFIWTSPPCQSHTRMRNLSMVRGYEPKYPSMILYEEIIFLEHFYKGKYVVENVISYYQPLIKPQESDNHYFWANFIIGKLNGECRGIRSEGKDFKIKKTGFDVDKFDIDERLKRDILNNCVKSEVGLHIFNMAFKQKQVLLNEIPNNGFIIKEEIQ